MNERLRELGLWDLPPEQREPSRSHHDNRLHAALDEIERLRAALERAIDDARANRDG